MGHRSWYNCLAVQCYGLRNEARLVLSLDVIKLTVIPIRHSQVGGVIHFFSEKRRRVATVEVNNPTIAYWMIAFNRGEFVTCLEKVRYDDYGPCLRS
jgi:hypothetical protein